MDSLKKTIKQKCPHCNKPVRISETEYDLPEFLQSLVKDMSKSFQSNTKKNN